MEKRLKFQLICFLTILLVLNTAMSSSNVQIITKAIAEIDNWEISSPEEQGMNSSKLSELESYITINYPGIYSMVIIRNGYLVAEEYFKYPATTKRNIYSCTKSFTSALIGIAIEEGYIESINESVLDFFPSYTFANTDERKQNMTLYHLLTMTTGLNWDESNYDDPQNPIYLMWDSSDWIQYVLDQEMVNEPGTTFEYNTGASHVISAIINSTTGMSTQEYAESRLFNPLGIEDYTWPTDPNGIHKGGEGLELTPRSLAKLGQLYLSNGTWKGQQLVPEDWVHDSVHCPLNPPTNIYYGYGYQWWLHPGGDIFSAWGYAHQRVIVVPEYNIVTTITSYMTTIGGDPAASLVNEFVIPAVLTSENDEETTTTTTISDKNVTTSLFTILSTLLVFVIKRKKKLREF